jgi:hypothetical protein
MADFASRLDHALSAMGRLNTSPRSRWDLEFYAKALRSAEMTLLRGRESGVSADRLTPLADAVSAHYAAQRVTKYYTRLWVKEHRLFWWSRPTPPVFWAIYADRAFDHWTHDREDTVEQVALLEGRMVTRAGGYTVRTVIPVWSSGEPPEFPFTRTMRAVPGATGDHLAIALGLVREGADIDPAELTELVGATRDASGT